MFNISWRVVGKENKNNLQNHISQLPPQQVHIVLHIMGAYARF